MKDLGKEQNQREKKLSIVIPLFNEAKNISQLYVELKPVMEGLEEEYEIIFVDDGSCDNSFSILEDLYNRGQTVKAIQFTRNFGKSAALSTGFKQTRGKIVITMDADLQDDPREIPHFIHQLEQGYDLVSGWRFPRKDPLSKILASKVFNCLTSAFTGVKVHDFNCGFKAYREKVVKDLDLYGELYRYIPVLANWKGYKIGEVKVRHRSRIHGQSKYSTGRLFRGMADLITVMFLTKYMEKPLHLFGGIGLLLFLAGLVVNVYLVILKLLGQGIADRPLLWLGILLIVVGLQIVSTGLIGEMIASKSGKSMQNYIIKKILK